MLIYLKDSNRFCDFADTKKINPKLFFHHSFTTLGYSIPWGLTLELLSGYSSYSYYLHSFVSKFQSIQNLALRSKAF